MVEATGLEETIRGLEEVTVLLPDDDGIDDEVYAYLMLPRTQRAAKLSLSNTLFSLCSQLRALQFHDPCWANEFMSIIRTLEFILPSAQSDEVGARVVPDELTPRETAGYARYIQAALKRCVLRHQCE